MDNPWLCLTDSEPYVVPNDKPHLDAFGATLVSRHQKPENHDQTREDYQLHLELLPTPYVGNPRTASVLVLQLNPSYHPKDCCWDQRDDYRETSMANLRHESLEHPFFLLDPAFHDSPASKWWVPKLDELLQGLGDVKDARSLLARSLAAVEFHGYHSKQYRAIPVTLPSQRYGFDLVRSAIRRNAVIVIARGYQDWCIAVPELLDHPSAYEISNPQTTHISPRNLLRGPSRVPAGKEGFSEILQALKG